MTEHISPPSAETLPCTVGDYLRGLLSGIIGAALVALAYWFGVGVLHWLPLMFPAFGVIIGFTVWMAVGERRNRLLPLLAAPLGFLGIFVGRMATVFTMAVRQSISMSPGELFDVTWETLDLMTWGILIVTSAVTSYSTYLWLHSPPAKTVEAKPDGSSAELEANQSADDTSAPQLANTAE